MKRDMELIRKILFSLEAQEEDRDPGRIEIDGYSPEQVAYHAYLLVDAGLCMGWDATHLEINYRDIRPTRLTWAGHEFLDAARSESRWTKAMDRIKSIGGTVTVGVLTQVLTQMAKDELGLR